MCPPCLFSRVRSQSSSVSQGRLATLSQEDSKRSILRKTLWRWFRGFGMSVIFPSSIWGEEDMRLPCWSWSRWPAFLLLLPPGQCVCSWVCIWCWLLCRCACELERVLCEEVECSNDRNTFSSSVGMSIEWLTGVSQVLGSRPDVFSCELKINLRLWCIHCVRTILSPGCAIPSLIFHYQCVCSCVCIWCWLLCRCACESERVLCEEAKCSNDHNTFKLLGGHVDSVTD